MGRSWWDDAGVRSRSTGPLNLRFLAWILVALMMAGATGGAYALTAEHRPAPARPTPLRIMPLGDSITLGPDEGGGFSGGWRPLLAQRLAEDGLNVRFAGRLTTGNPPLPHEAYGGRRIDEIRALVDAAMAAADPDLVLLHIGTNDIGQHYALDAAPARMRDLAARVCVDRPGVVLVVAAIIPVGSQEQLVDRYDAAIPGVVGDLQASGCDARYVDMRDAVPSAATLFDGVHPDPAGYAAMADTWYPLVRDAYDHPGPVAAGSVDDDVLDYTGYWTHDRGEAGAYLADEHHSGSTGDAVSWTFRGTGIELRGATGPSGGIAAVSMDGGAGVPVDFYTPDAAEQVLVYRSPVLTDATHTIRVRVTGDRDPAAAAAVVSVDRLVISGRAA